MAEKVGVAALIFALAAFGVAVACAIVLSMHGMFPKGNIQDTFTVGALKADSIAASGAVTANTLTTAGPITANSATIGSIACRNLTSSYAIYVNDVAGVAGTTIYNDGLTTHFITADGRRHHTSRKPVCNLRVNRGRHYSWQGISRRLDL